MPQLVVRNVPDQVVRRLRIQAAQHGRSAEAEHRLILRQALGEGEGDFWAEADAMRNASRRQRTESGRLQRELRDQR